MYAGPMINYGFRIILADVKYPHPSNLIFDIIAMHFFLTKKFTYF